MKIINNYINSLENSFFKVKLKYSFETIKRVDSIINYHNQNETNNKDLIMINIFGLLQSMFVSIDALYTLTISITNSKNYININQNENINNLKFIRNDVVGHPINRKYRNNSTGYGIINEDTLKYNSFDFNIYIKNNDTISNKTTNINLKNIKDSYTIEKDKVIKKLNHYLTKKYSKTNLDQLLINLHNDLTIDNINLIKNVYIKNYTNTNDRFIWRIYLLEVLINWNETDKDISSVINYLKYKQINKLIYIINEIENKNTKPNKINVPNIVKKINTYFENNKQYIKYLKDISDYNNPSYEYNLNYLINNIEDELVLKYLNFLKQQTKRSKIYLIGSILNNYYKSML